MNEEKNIIGPKLYFDIIYTLLIIFIFVNAFFFTFDNTSRYEENLKAYSGNWLDESGNWVIIDEVLVGRYGGKVTLFNTLPDHLDEGDNLFFETKNVNIRAFIDDREVYSFTTRENLTGMGYGIAFHEIVLSEDCAGKTLRFEYEGVSSQEYSGTVMKVYIGPSRDYLCVILNERGSRFFNSMLIIFFGFLMMAIWLFLRDKSRLAFDMVALGGVSILMGLWTLINTNCLLILTGHIFVWRVLSILLIPTIGYPVICFCNSFTKVKRKVYEYIAFFVSGIAEVLLIALRMFYGIDMTNTVIYAALAVLLTDAILFAILSIDNKRYCRKNNLPTELKAFHLGLILLVGISSIDGVFYLLKIGPRDATGRFSSIGMLIFIMVMLLHFINLWTKNQDAMDRDRFINKSLQVAIASKNPVESIKLLLEFLGIELGAARAYIYEDLGKGRFRNTYEWFADGLDPNPKDVTELPYKGCISELEKRFNSGENCILVKDIEKIQKDYPIIYDRLKKANATNTVLSPLESNGKLVGFLGINDIPVEIQKSVAEIAGIMSFFFAQFINQRQEQDKMLYYSYHDSVSGAKNRNALKEYTDQRMDLSQAFGYVICEIVKLKEINEVYGHDAGDKIVIGTAEIMMEAFGEDNVYRLSGEEFIAFGFEIDEIYFNNDIERIKRLFKDRDFNVIVGAVYCSNGTSDLKNVTKYAHDLLEKDKGETSGK
jgi:diguanylate cyclase (GGDEF)-like protein